MNEKAKKHKLVSAIVAVSVAAAILLTGTYAWQSISQQALNEAQDMVNPGGRLHDEALTAGTRMCTSKTS